MQFNSVCYGFDASDETGSNSRFFAVLRELQYRHLQHEIELRKQMTMSCVTRGQFVEVRNR
jgi:hypothetical protein